MGTAQQLRPRNQAQKKEETYGHLRCGLQLGGIALSRTVVLSAPLMPPAMFRPNSGAFLVGTCTMPGWETWIFRSPPREPPARRHMVAERSSL